MKLFYSPFHAFVHKVLVCAHETGYWPSLTRVATFPFKNLAGEMVRGEYSLAALNPLDKVPTLATDAGQVIYGSQAICEYLDANSRGARLYPDPGPARWDALTRMALCDMGFEMTVTLAMERWREPTQRNLATYEWLWPKLRTALGKLERDASCGWPGFDIGHASMLHFLSYLGYWCGNVGDDDPLQPNFDWRAGHPQLAAWYDTTLQRESVRAHFQQPFSGDTSPEYHRRMVEEVLAVQRAQCAPTAQQQQAYDAMDGLRR
jgi:glutathione S-transferase